MTNLGLDLVKVTEEAAIAASAWVGSGNKLKADEAATNAIRKGLNSLETFRAKVVLGEGIKDKMPGLFAGELVGYQSLNDVYELCLPYAIPTYDLCIDPIDGTRPTVNHGPGAISVMALANMDCMYATEAHYLHKVAFGRQLNESLYKKYSVDLLRLPVKELVAIVKTVLGRVPTVCILERPRHTSWIKEFRDAGCILQLISDCDVTGAISTCIDSSPADILYGVGGASEAVLAAAALKCMGGNIICREVNNEVTRYGEILSQEQLIRGACCFVATGITDGPLLRGVNKKNKTTHSVFMSSLQNTVSYIENHRG